MTDQAEKSPEWPARTFPPNVSSDPGRIRARLTGVQELLQDAGHLEDAKLLSDALVGMSTHVTREKKRACPIEKFVQGTSQRRALSVLRMEAERNFAAPPPPPERVLGDPEEGKVVKMPAPYDPIAAWLTAPRVEDGACPRTFKPKARKADRGMPRQQIAELIWRAGRVQLEWQHWRIALDTFTTWEMREVMWEMVLDRMSLRKACERLGLQPDGRNCKVVRQNVLAALDAVSDSLGA